MIELYCMYNATTKRGGIAMVEPPDRAHTNEIIIKKEENVATRCHSTSLLCFHPGMEERNINECQNKIVDKGRFVHRSLRCPFCSADSKACCVNNLKQKEACQRLGSFTSCFVKLKSAHGLVAVPPTIPRFCKSSLEKRACIYSYALVSEG